MATDAWERLREQGFIFAHLKDSNKHLGNAAGCAMKDTTSKFKAAVFVPADQPKEQIWAQWGDEFERLAELRHLSSFEAASKLLERAEQSNGTT